MHTLQADAVSREQSKLNSLTRLKVFIISMVLSFAAVPAVQGMDLPENCWQAVYGLKQTKHAYYDIPAWNCNGSLLFLIGTEESGNGKTVRRPYLVANLGSSEKRLVNTERGEGSTSMKWDARDPNVLYYSMRGDAPDTTVLRRHNLLTGSDEVLATAQGDLQLVVPHPDGEHLLLAPGVAGSDDLVLVSISDRKQVRVPLPAAVHRVRFTKHPDLSVFFNTETDDLNDRESYIMNLFTGERRLLIKGRAGHPDWSPDGQRLSYFTPDGLNIMDRNGTMVRQIPGLAGHQSWSNDGKYIVFEEGNYRAKDASGVEKQFKNYIALVEPVTGIVTPLMPSQTKKGKSQDTHAHPGFSPDGTKVIFVSNNLATEDPQAYVVKARDPDPVKQLSLEQEGVGYRISWIPPQANETKSFVIFRLLPGDKASVVAEIPLGSTSYMDVTAPADVRGYAVAAKEYSGLQSPLATISLQ